MSNSLSNYNKVGKNIIGAPKKQNNFALITLLENKEKFEAIVIAEFFPLLFAIALKSENKRKLYMIQKRNFAPICKTMKQRDKER